MWAYYNENDEQKAEWLNTLMQRGVIAPGLVDNRSIKDVRKEDIRGFRQCHWFAGIGVWSYALRQAGWRDDRPVWTGSAPCQPFSAAGERKGVADERHLWPEWYRLVKAASPACIFGEQVASKDGLGWWDGVHADLENAGYAGWHVDACAAGFGAYHIRQRLYWVAEHSGLEHPQGDGRQQRGSESGERGIVGGCSDGGMGYPQGIGRERWQDQHDSRRWECTPGQASTSNRLGHPGNQRLPLSQQSPVLPAGRGVKGGAIEQSDSTPVGYTAGRPGPNSAIWANPDWLRCTDGKWRPTESVALPLADGAASDLGYLRDPGTGEYYSFPLIQKGKARVIRLKGYGDAIVLPQAVAFIQSYMELLSTMGE